MWDYAVSHLNVKSIWRLMSNHLTFNVKRMHPVYVDFVNRKFSWLRFKIPAYNTQSSW